ncbi:MAG: cupin domain-containing protein [Egibacteraceae bacterium]
MRRNRAVIAAVLAFVGGLALGVGGMSALENAPPAPPPFDASGRLELLPQGPVDVTAETVRLPRGFTNRHRHGGPTFNFIRSGQVRIKEEDGSVRQFGPGQFFFEPAEQPHTIEVESDARLDVLRLVPPGSQATTTLPTPTTESSP